MKWDKHEITHFAASAPSPDMNSPPTVGDRAILTTHGNEFEVEIRKISSDDFTGEVTTIGPTPALEAVGVKRGATVQFKRENIHTLYRK